MNFCQESSILADHLVARNDGTVELSLEMKPSCDFADFVESVRCCTQNISSLHVHNMFLKELKANEQADILNALHGLKEIYISYVSLPVRLLANLLVRCSKQLQILSLERIVLLAEAHDSPSHDDAVFFSALQSLEALEDLHISVSSTVAVPEGQKLFFQVDDVFDTVFQSLSGTTTLKKLYVSIGQNLAGRTNIQPQTLGKLLHGSAINDLTLVHFPLHKEHCQAIVSAKVNLKSLSLIKAGFGDEGAIALAEGLTGNDRSLESLSLPGNKLTDMGGSMIVKAFSVPDASFKLKALDVHGNHFTAAFGKQLAILLTTKSKMSCLDVSNNQLEDEGVQAIVMALRKNSTLTQLNLFATQLTNKSCESFAGLFRVNTTLKRLNLYNNENISSQGIQVLAEAVKEHNCFLERLEVSRNKFEGDFGLDMYLRLNREYGRGKMLSSPATNELEYVNGIHRAVAKNDLDSMFYFIHAKPSLCC